MISLRSEYSVLQYEKEFGRRNSMRMQKLLSMILTAVLTVTTLSGHGLLLDPVSEVQYDKALFRYCETYFG